MDSAASDSSQEYQVGERHQGYGNEVREEAAPFRDYTMHSHINSHNDDYDRTTEHGRGMPTMMEAGPATLVSYPDTQKLHTGTRSGVNSSMAADQQRLERAYGSNHEAAGTSAYRMLTAEVKQKDLNGAVVPYI